MRQRRQCREAGEVVEGDARHVGGEHAVAQPAKAERPADGVVVHGADRLAGHLPDDLAEDEAAGDGMVRELPAGPRRERHLAEHREDALRILEHVEVHRLRRRIGQPGAMREHVPDRDPLLSVHREPRDVLGDRVVEAEHVPLVEEVDDHCRHGLRRREQPERRIGRRERLRRLGRIVGPVARRVAERAIEQHRAAMAHAERERGMDAASVDVLRGRPDACDRLRIDADRARIDLGLAAHRRHRLEGRRHARAGDQRRQHVDAGRDARSQTGSAVLRIQE